MLRHLLARPRAALLAVLAVTLLAWLPTLATGRMADDHFFSFALQELPDQGPMANLFALVDSREEVRVFREHGILPWWAADDMRIVFWRPLPSLTHWLDARLFGESAVAAHAVSLGWYLLVVALAWRVWSRFFPAGSPLLPLATLLFALDDAHALNVGWIASRNDLIGGAFLLLAVLGLQRWREHGRPRDLALLFGSFAAALASKESSVIFPALATAHVLWVGRDGWRAHLRRHATLLTAVWAGALGWLAFYVSSGFGPNTLYYLNPTRNPDRWAGALVDAAAAHLSILATGVPLHTLTPDPVADLPALVVACGALTALTVALGVRLLRHDATNLFFLAWTAAGLAVVTTGFPDPRLLFVASMGAAPLLARLAGALWAARDTLPHGRRLVAGFAALHLVLAPGVVEGSLAVIGSLDASAERATAALRADVDYARLADAPAHVFFLNWERRETTPLATLRLVRALPLGADVSGLLRAPDRTYAERVDAAFGAARVSYHLLSTLPAVEVERVDSHTLRLRAPEGGFFPTVFERLYLTGEAPAEGEPDRTARSSAAFERATLFASSDGAGRDGAPRRPGADDNGASDAEKRRDETGACARIGETRTLGAFRATVEAAQGGEVQAVRFELPEPLDHPSHHFLVWRDGRWQEGLPPDERLAGVP